MRQPSSLPGEPLLEIEIDEIQRAGCARRTVGGEEILVVATSEGPRVYSGVCPHLGGPLIDAVFENGRLRCPWHRYEFDAATGVSVVSRTVERDERCDLALGAPPSLRLRSLRFEVDGGKLRVFGPS